jgi:long-chain fatty acid transport protein
MLKNGYFKGISGFVTAFCVLWAIPNAYGSGFGIFTQSASSLGQGAAVAAHTSSPSTIFFNPALMNNLDGTQIEVGTTLFFPQREFTDPAGNKFDNQDNIYATGTFYLTHKFNDKLSAGLGVFNPFGLGTQWDGNWEGRYIATKSQMAVFNINPVASYRILPGVSLAAGLDIIVLDATFERKINLSGFGFPDAGQKFQCDDTGVGFNIGFAADLTKNITLGASYRSEVKLDPSGTVSYSVPSGIPPQLGSLFQGTGAKTHLTLPQQVYAGFAYKDLGPLTMEVGMRWEGWSSFHQMTVTLDNGMSQTTPRNWKDTFAINFGAQYKLNDTVSLLGGYLYGQNPVPDSTFEPAIPDSDTHLFCIGADLKFKQFSIALAYAYQLQLDRTKNNTIGDPFSPGTGTANGRYSTDMQMLAISLGYRF